MSASRVSKPSVAGLAVIVVAIASSALLGSAGSAVDFARYRWTELTGNAEWAPRAGLQVVELGNRFYLLGGRTPKAPSFPPIPGDSTIWSDVWTSADQGRSWSLVLGDAEAAGYWPARAYFQAVTRANQMYVLGGQNFKAGAAACGPVAPSCSDFFDDVWSSRDGATWTRLTRHAGWQGRAGLSAIVHRNEIFVLGGSKNDDSSIVNGPPARIYFNDVWKSLDGRTWSRVAEHAPWAPRAGAVVVEKEGWMYLLGGEEGFTCSDPAKPCPPYFNDVWRSRDGAAWERVTPAAGWSPRPGHQCAVLLNTFVCFGGFGLPAGPIVPGQPIPPANPMDVWVSRDGARWQQVSDAPWNAASPGDVKYDFDVLVVQGARGGLRPSIFTFGGDRETFDFFDPGNYLKVDNDVWRFGPPLGR